MLERSQVTPKGGRVSGTRVFTGTRMPVSVVFENLEDGMSVEELMQPQMAAAFDAATPGSFPEVVSPGS
jgi:Protein of unknown function (DUF433)